MRSFKTKYPMLVSALAIAFSGASLADDVQKKSNELEVIEVSPKGLISYVSASASKSDVPITKTPVSVSVLTSKRISDLGAETLQDAIGYVAGVYNGPYGVDTRGDWSKIRGVDPLTYIDGLQMQFGHYNNTRTNPYTLERVEILKGPSSVLYGQGSTGGIINSVSKRPHSETQGEIWAQLGNYDRAQIAGDYNTAFGQDEQYQARFVGVYRNSDTQTDFVEDNTLVFAPSFAWDISQDTRLTLLTNFQENESGSSTQFFPHEGTLLPAKYGQIPSERFVSEPGWDRYDTEQMAVTAILEHSISDDTQVRWSTRYSDSSSEYRTIFSWPPKFEADKRSVNRIFSMSDGESKSFLSDIQVHQYIEFSDIEVNIVAGIDFQDAETRTSRLRGAVSSPLDLYNPVYGQNDPLPTAITAIAPEQTDTQVGGYVQATFEYQGFILNTALRHDDVEQTNWQKVDDIATLLKVEKSQSALTGRVGALYQFENGLSPYASYSESFQPLYGSKPQGGGYEPKEGQQFEYGVKYQPAGTEHLITASVFHITDKNHIRQISPLEHVQDGEVSVDGFELEAQLEWDNLDIYASYAYTTSEQDTTPLSADAIMTQAGLLAQQTQDPAQKQAIIGGAVLAIGTDDVPLSATPEHLASVWATYRADNLLEGLKFGAGIRYVGKTFDGSRSVSAGGFDYHKALTTDSFTLYDMMVGYQFSDYELSLNIDNLTDKTVITSCLYRGDCFYGQRRTITANLKYRF
ncbi:TonB-dependent siderophore receptor [Pseudoalteromonas sp. Of7M-16]|uniref:TonB-dependent siderophore receptor n=1 Tax=Pseudoalteromonas sp. Of7M-16 TaxID=2917756 RepID=UPI001EF402A2|nr:TonB-dependent siderophore receptor [Pseudoalteromonas sp. Of7M-16]MCG7550803.1 TonB-dependent siderophore receptor [Pseudoalteromonas sp. Of7M-16]